MSSSSSPIPDSAFPPGRESEAAAAGVPSVPVPVPGNGAKEEDSHHRAEAGNNKNTQGTQRQKGLF